MPPELRDEVFEWLSRARNDIYGADVLSSVDPPAPGIACYLCQQAVEKAFKAFLVKLRGATKVLNPYAAQFRYPGRHPDPAPERAREALRLARETLAFVLERLPEELSS